MLVDRIARGQWRLGELLPAENALAEELSVSVGTLRKALELLESGHIITRQQGRGTFVADYANSGMMLRFNPFRAADGSLLHGPPVLLEQVQAVATVTEVARLGLTEGQTVLRCRSLRCRDDVPYMLEQTVKPAHRFPQLGAPPLPKDCEILALAQSHGIVVGRIAERVRALATPPDVAGALNLAEGTPIIELDRTTHDVNGEIIEWRLSWCDLGDGWYAQDR